MMTSEKPFVKENSNEAFVWIWLPGETTAVVAGRSEADIGNLLFNYGKSYLERISDTKPAIPIYEPELEQRLTVLAKKTKRSKSYLAKEVLRDYIDRLENQEQRRQETLDRWEAYEQ